MSGDTEKCSLLVNVGEIVNCTSFQKGSWTMCIKIYMYVGIPLEEAIPVLSIYPKMIISQLNKDMFIGIGSILLLILMKNGIKANACQ